MLIETERRFFTRHDLERMFEAGILEDDERVELLDGEIIKMSNPGRRHIACTNRTNRLFVLALEGRAIVSIQNPLVLDLYNEPKPDVVVVQPREDFYQEVEIAAERALLIVEIGYDSRERPPKKVTPLSAAWPAGVLDRGCEAQCFVGLS
jgi:Uma2 family endonuclease